jgi:hypothetical protein
MSPILLRSLPIDTCRAVAWVQARDVVLKDPRMRDYAGMHVGAVTLRPKTSEERREEERRQK